MDFVLAREAQVGDDGICVDFGFQQGRKAGRLGQATEREGWFSDLHAVFIRKLGDFTGI